jgi:hypothetical protein
MPPRCRKAELVLTASPCPYRPSSVVYLLAHWWAKPWLAKAWESWSALPLAQPWLGVVGALASVLARLQVRPWESGLARLPVRPWESELARRPVHL